MLTLISILLFGTGVYERIGIISAMDVELGYIKEQMQVEHVDTVSRRIFASGKIKGAECVLVMAGVGKVNAGITAEILTSKYNVDAIIFSGVAGGIDPKLDIGDIIISEKVFHHDYGVIEPGGFTPWDTVGYEADTFLMRLARDKAGSVKFQEIPEKICKETGHYPRVKTGRVVTGDQFIASEVKRQWLEKTFRADCVEMEGAAVAQVCAINRIPFLIIRCLSDLANENADVDFDAFADYAARNSSALVVEIVGSLKQ